MRIGFIGLGAMGLPMTGHLVKAGHAVAVASRSRDPIDAAVALGAHDAGTPAAVAEVSEVIFVCVPNSPEVAEVIDAMLGSLGPGQTVVDCSTIDPADGAEPAQPGRRDRGALPRCASVRRHRRGAQRRADAHGRRGRRRPSPTSRRSSTPFAGLIVHVGGPGMGQVVKLCNNLIYAAQMTATAEATALAVKSGVDMHKLYEVMTHATGDCVAVRTRLPVPGWCRRARPRTTGSPAS